MALVLHVSQLMKDVKSAPKMVNVLNVIIIKISNMKLTMINVSKKKKKIRIKQVKQI